MSIFDLYRDLGRARFFQNAHAKKKKKEIWCNVRLGLKTNKF